MADQRQSDQRQSNERKGQNPTSQAQNKNQGKNYRDIRDQSESRLSPGMDQDDTGNVDRDSQRQSSFRRNQ